MAIDLCSASESCSGLGVSPRISFSHDLRHSDVVPMEEKCQRSDGSLLDSSLDFEFGVSASFEQEPPFSADELFFGGKILPSCEIWDAPPHSTQTHHQPTTNTTKPPLPSPPPLPLPILPLPLPLPRTHNTATTTLPKLNTVSTDDSKKESLKEIMATSAESEDKASSKSFWRFSRSTSLNSGNGQKRSLVCSLPLLSRSNSTGSSTNSKRQQPLLRDSQKHSHKPPTPAAPAKSCHPQKPRLKKNSGSNYGNGGGVRISPVLNIPPPYIAKGTASLFGLGSLLCGGSGSGSGKDKNKKK